MKRILLCGWLLLCIGTQAQIQRGLKGDYNTANFPEISFVWNSANPEVLKPSQFALTENGKNVDFQFTVVTPERSVQKPKNILFLWEDMASHRGQLNFARTVLNRFFYESEENGNDRFNVAVFNRKEDAQSSVLQPLLSDFTADRKKLSTAVKNYKGSSKFFSTYPTSSDLYLAIHDGINWLKKQSADQVGVIVVITAGLNIKASGASTEMASVQKNATDAGIPIYVVKYPFSGNTTEINTLAESTYGLSVVSTNPETAGYQLQNFYQDFDSRVYGQDYQIIFTSSAKRDGASHPIHLSMDKVQQQIPPFSAPKMSLGVWIKENLWLSIVLAIVFIAVVVTAIMLIDKKQKEKKAKIREDLEQVRRVADAKANAAQRDAERIRQEQIAYQQKQEREKYSAEQQAEQERLAELMQTKNLFPRLQCKAGNNSFTHTIGKPLTKLGRGAGNDVVLNHQTVSGFHAEISFTNGGFEITNKSKSYKQGIIVNGQFFQRTTLKSGDIIGLGEAVITFYV